MIRFKRSTASYPVIIVLAVVFSVGLALGALALFYVPEDLLKEAMVSFDVINTDTYSFKTQFKENFIMEFCWIAMIWILGRFNMTAPLIAAVMSLRGFVLGFSIAFMLQSGEGVFEVVIGSIMPQCAIALPVMSVFAMMCIQSSVSRQGNNKETGYMLKGVIFVFVTVAVSVLEVLLMQILGKIL